MAVSRSGEPIPWYTYSAIDFFRFRDFTGQSVLEFGGGQSTLWWAKRAESIVSFEGDQQWYNRIKDQMPGNVNLYHVSMEDKEANLKQIRKILDDESAQEYQVIIIDGLFRFELIEIACERLAEGGVIICDNAESYHFYDGFKERGMDRVDFYGYAPGVVLPHSTSVYFKGSSFVFDPAIPIHAISKEP